MLYFFTRYQLIVESFLKYFNIDITLFSEYERSIVILLSNILGIIIISIGLAIFYKMVCRIVGAFR